MSRPRHACNRAHQQALRLATTASEVSKELLQAPALYLVQLQPLPQSLLHLLAVVEGLLVSALVWAASEGLADTAQKPQIPQATPPDCVKATHAVSPGREAAPS